MKKFEYKVFCNSMGWDPDPERGLTKLGAQGWELCSVIQVEGDYQFFFKREVEVPVTGIQALFNQGVEVSDE